MWNEILARSLQQTVAMMLAVWYVSIVRCGLESTGPGWGPLVEVFGFDKGGENGEFLVQVLKEVLADLCNSVSWRGA